MTGSIAPNRPGHHGTVVARTVGTVAISCVDQRGGQTESERYQRLLAMTI